MLPPTKINMTRDECKKYLRFLELDAYANMVSVLRAQGTFTPDKRKLLLELANVLHISNERHRAEIRRAVNDDKLSVVAEQLNGSNTGTDWAIEGRRTIPLLPRLKARTAFTTLANSVSLATSIANEKQPKPVEKIEEFKVKVETEPDLKVPTSQETNYVSRKRKKSIQEAVENKKVAVSNYEIEPILPSTSTENIVQNPHLTVDPLRQNENQNTCLNLHKPDEPSEPDSVQKTPNGTQSPVRINTQVVLQDVKSSNKALKLVPVTISNNVAKVSGTPYVKKILSISHANSSTSELGKPVTRVVTVTTGCASFGTNSSPSIKLPPVCVNLTQSGTKLASKGNVFLVQKGSSRGVTLSHAGKEVLGKVIMGGKHFCLSNQNSVALIPNGDQTKIVSVSNKNTTKPKGNNMIVFDLRQDAIEKNDSETSQDSVNDATEMKNSDTNDLTEKQIEFYIDPNEDNFEVISHDEEISQSICDTNVKKD